MYTKLLIGKSYPKSKCYVEDGNLLTIIPGQVSIASENVDHVFSNVLDTKIKSVYGWVKDTHPFTIADFVSKYTNRKMAEDEIKNLTVMFEAIAKLPEDTVVKVRYTRRGIEEKRMDLVVHKVFFYD